MLWQGAAPKMVKVGKLRLTAPEYNRWRGKFNRFMARKPASGKLEVPEELHKIWLSKSTEKDELFESYIRVDGQKVRRLTDLKRLLTKDIWNFSSYIVRSEEQFLRRVTLKKTTEKSSELDEEGGYYTPQEMAKLLNYPQCLACLYIYI